jgi:hypothetical protein
MRQGISLVLLILGFSAFSSADSRARIVRLSYLEGDVQLDRRDSRGFQRAFVNMPIIEGARVWTRTDGRAEIEFEDGGTLRLAPETIIEFRELALTGNGDRTTAIDLQEGTLYGNLKHHKGDVRITYAQDEISLAKDSRFRLGLSKVEMRLAVFRGELQMRRFNGERVSVRKNETLSISFDDPERYYLAKGINEEAHDYWDRDREDERSRYAARQSYHSYPAVYSYGYPDLYAYGSFFNVSGYGVLWRPYYVSFGWSPFADGSWVWYPGFGYVWVSPYAWGWTPYRYGSWVFIHNRGWCWRGGGHFNSWFNITNVHNAPPNFHHPLRPVVPPQNTGGIVNVGRGGSPIPLSPEDRPVRTGVRNRDPGSPRILREDVRPSQDRPVVTGVKNRDPGSPSVLREGLSNNDRPHRDLRDANGVITNETLGTSSSVGGETGSPSVSNADSEKGSRGSRDERGTGITKADPTDRIRPRRETSDPDYNAVDYRSTQRPGGISGQQSGGISIDGDTRNRTSHTPTDIEADSRQRGGGVSPGAMPDRASPAVVNSPAPTVQDRSSRPMVNMPVDRGDRGERPVRSERANPPSPPPSMPASAPAQVSRPSPSASMPSMSAPAPVSRPSSPPSAAPMHTPAPAAAPPAAASRSERPRGGVQN